MMQPLIAQDLPDRWPEDKERIKIAWLTGQMLQGVFQSLLEKAHIAHRQP